MSSIVSSSAPSKERAEGWAPPAALAPSRQFVKQLRAAAAPCAGLFLGLGLAGALLDGILLQQGLGWHPISTHSADAHQATSLFFVATLATLLVGLDLLFRLPAEVRRRGRREIAGWTFIGAGLFELLVGLGDHHLFALRHVRPDVANVALWDLAYLGAGVSLCVICVLLPRRGNQLSRPARSTALSSGDAK